MLLPYFSVSVVGAVFSLNVKNVKRVGDHLDGLAVHQLRRLAHIGDLRRALHQAQARDQVGGVLQLQHRDAMLRNAPPSDQVMNEVANFIGERPLLAHNASFDQKFWDFELGRIKRTRLQNFACSLLLARRLMPAAPNHKLGTLNTFAGLPHTGQAHRAMADAEMAANLTAYLTNELRQTHGLSGVSHQLLCSLQKVPAAKISEAIKRQRGF